MSAPPGGPATFSRVYYRLLLLAYPSDFRLAHGEDAADVFVDLARATRLRGLLPLALLWLRSALTVVTGGVEERRGTGRRAAGPHGGRGPSLDTFTVELRQAHRALLRRPAFALMAILTLALGIGATTAVFSVVDTVLLRPLPFPESERLITVRHLAPEIAAGEWGMSQAGYLYFRRQAETLEDIGAFFEAEAVITGDGPPERIGAARVTASLLAVLGVEPQLGRPFGVDDDLPGAPPVVLLSHGLWTRSYGADPDIIGTTITLDGLSREVIGVMPPSFRFPARITEAWLPMGFDPSAPPVNQHTYPGLARLGEGVSQGEAQAELDGLVARFADEMPRAYGGDFMERSGFRVVVRGLLEGTVGGVRTLLWIVLTAAVLVLTIACANVANLAMLRSEGRRREVAVRAALGAGRGALLRYALAEAALLALAGGALGLALAWAGVRLLVLMAPAGLARIDEIAVRPLAGLVVLGIVAVIAAMLGTVSALRGRARLSDQLKVAGRTGSAHRQSVRARGAFVVTQVSLAVLLMTGSGVLLRSFVNLTSVDPGFNPDNVLTLQLSLSPTKYPDAEPAFAFFEQVTDRIRALPGVTAVGLVAGLPLVSRAADNANGIADLPDGSEQMLVTDTKFAGPGYFEALGMRIIEGRVFERADMDAATPGAVITRAMAQQLWPNQSALGKRVRPLLREFPWHTVVGVVDDVLTEDFTRDPEPIVYFPYTDLTWYRSFDVAIRTDGPPEPLLPAVRREVWAMDADVPLGSVATMRELVGDHLSRTSFTLTLVAVAATIALFLCAVGIYGVIAFSVSQRHFEIGVRMALGARAPQVAGMVLQQTMALAGAGIVVGLGLAVAGMNLMRSLLFEVAPTDPLTLASVSFGLVLLASLAGALPALRATRVEAVVALQRD